MTTADFTVDGKAFTAIVSLEKSPGDRPRKSMHAFVWGPGDDWIPSKDPGIERALNESGSETIYTRRGDFPEVDKAWDAFNRRVVKAKRVVLNAALAALKIETKEIYFDKKTGCSCGCSPGFVIKAEGFEGMDMSISGPSTA